MDSSFIAQIVLIWMMLSISMSNFLSCKSWVSEILDLDSGHSMNLGFLPLLFLAFACFKEETQCNT